MRWVSGWNWTKGLQTVRCWIYSLELTPGLLIWTSTSTWMPRCVY